MPYINPFTPTLRHILFLARLLFLRYSNLILTGRKIRRKVQQSARRALYLAPTIAYAVRRRYGRRFYRKLFNRRYIKSVSIKT